MDRSVQCRDLDFYYGGFQALKKIDVDICRKEITALIGPSGCGKSTFLRCLNRMNDLIPGTRTEGSILIDGIEINNGTTDLVDLRKKVGMVFQRPNPFPLSIFENVAFGPRIHRMARGAELHEIVESSLQKVLLWDEFKDKLNRNALSLTLEQQQRLCIARLVAVRPEILLMDEPCSALDPVAIQRIEDLMRFLKKDYTIVIVTHNMQQAARISDYTAFFYKGYIVEYGLTEQIFRNPVKKETEDYITGRFG